MIDAKTLAAALALAALSLLPRVAAADPPRPTAVPPVDVANGGNPANDDARAARGESPTLPELSWLTAYRFHLAAASVRTDDPRFDWDAHFGGDVDVLDYGSGRVNLLADYEVMIGSEFRTIDPNQGAYRLQVSASWRTGASEVQPLFHHVSRHLSDRANRQAVSWNGAGAAATTRYARGPFAAAVDVRGMKIVQAAFVDYTWQIGTSADTEYRVSPAAAIIVRGDLTSTFVDRQVAGRGTQMSGRVESGVRLLGKGAGVELFAAWERRLDPSPLERGTRNWALLGFRFVNR